MKFPCAKICQLSGFSKVLVSCFEWQQEFPLTVIPWDLFCWKISSFYILAINTPLWLKIEAARINLGDTGQRPGIWGCSHRLKCLVDRIQGFSPAGWQCNSGLLSDRAACEVLDAWCQAISLQVAILPGFSEEHCFWQILWQNSMDRGAWQGTVHGVTNFLIFARNP